MKQRLISALILSILIIPLIIIGGLFFKIGLSIISFLMIREILSVKNNIPNSLKIITYCLTILLIIIDSSSIIKIYITLMIYFSLLIFYEKEEYNIETCCYLCTFVILITIVLSSIYNIRTTDIYTLFYLLLISIFTDTFAYFGGTLFGKRRLIPKISPNKTLEGSLIGTFFGCLIPSIFYIYMVTPGVDVFSIIFLTLILSIIGQIGDLIFSSIKRYYRIKDFSNLLPGHGGMIDRLDSIFFIVIGYIVLINFI